MCGFTWHPEGVEQEKGDCDIACKKRETAHTRRKLGQHSVAGFRNTAQARKKGLKEEKLEIGHQMDFIRVMQRDFFPVLNVV